MRESRWPPSFLVLKFMSRKPTGVTSGAFFLRPCRLVGVPSPPAPEKPPIFSTQPIMPHRSGGSSWYESLAPLTIARDEQYIAAHKPVPPLKKITCPLLILQFLFPPTSFFGQIVRGSLNVEVNTPISSCI